MKKHTILFVFFYCLLALASCSEPKIDGSSGEAMMKSVKVIAQKLPPERADLFIKSVQFLMVSESNILTTMEGKDNSRDIDSLAKYIDKKTVDEVIALAAKNNPWIKNKGLKK